MAVFISHFLNDREQFANIADPLEKEGIAYWKPETMRPGAPLSDQLREGIRRCELCIFVATKNSVKSLWCGAELGAFWGAGKLVIIYMADSSLKPAQLPRQFEGHLLESRITKIVETAKDYLEKANAVDKASDGDRGGFSIEGKYVAPSGAVNVIKHLSRKVYEVQGRTWEGVGFVDGNFYYGIYKYSDNPDVAVAGNWGAHRAEIGFIDELPVFVIELRDKFESIGKLSIWKKASS